MVDALLPHLFWQYLYSGEPLLSYKYIILGGKRVATTSSTDILIRWHLIHNLHGISINNRRPSKEGRSPLDWRTPLNGVRPSTCGRSPLTHRTIVWWIMKVFLLHCECQSVLLWCRMVPGCRVPCQCEHSLRGLHQAPTNRQQDPNPVLNDLLGIGSDTILWSRSADRIPQTLITISSWDRENMKQVYCQLKHDINHSLGNLELKLRDCSWMKNVRLMTSIHDVTMGDVAT